MNGRVHSEIQAVPAERLEEEERKLLRPLPSLRAVLRRAEQRKVDRLQTVRFGSARYSVPSAYVGAPGRGRCRGRRGGHQRGAARGRPTSAAAAAGTTRLATELGEIAALEASWGRQPLLAALERARLFRRFSADGVRAILAAGEGAPNPVPEGVPLRMQLPDVPVRPLSAYALEAIR